MTTQDIINRITQDLKSGTIKVVSSDGYRYYTDVLTESIIVPITTAQETAESYKKLFIDVHTSTQNPQDLFDSLPRVSMFIGQPDTGKTYKSLELAKHCSVIPLFKMCRESLNLETLLEDFTLIDGKPVFEESLAIKYMSDNDKHIIILDEFNTLLTSVMKTFQPIFDETSTTFEYKGKIYNKNMNCKFFITLNDKDKGISVVPDAILSRSKLTWFDPVPLTTLAIWTGVDLEWISNLYNVYKALGLLTIFGSRQIKMLRQTNDITSTKNHLKGLCLMKNLDVKLLDTLQITNLLNKLQ